MERLEIARAVNGYIIEVDRYTGNSQRYAATTIEQATRIVSAVLAAGEVDEDAAAEAAE